MLNWPNCLGFWILLFKKKQCKKIHSYKNWNEKENIFKISNHSHIINTPIKKYSQIIDAGLQ